jgi:hypothetical protein
MTRKFLVLGESLKMLAVFRVIRERVETLDHLSGPADDAGESR